MGQVKDKRLSRAQRLEQQARTLRDEVEAERKADFPKVGEHLRVKGEGTRLVYGLNNLPIWGKTGTVTNAYFTSGEVVMIFPSVPVNCRECGKKKHYEKARLRYPQEVEKIQEKG